MAFSATYLSSVEEAIKQFMRRPRFILLSADKPSLEGVKQYFILCNPSKKKTKNVVEDAKSKKQNSSYAQNFARIKINGEFSGRGWCEWVRLWDYRSGIRFNGASLFVRFNFLGIFSNSSGNFLQILFSLEDFSNLFFEQ